MSEKKTSMEEEKALVPIVVPPLSTQEILDHFNKIQELKRKLINPETDIIKIGDKPYILKSGWRKLAFSFNLSDEIIREEKEERPDGEVIYRIWTKVTAPNGRSVVAVGCASTKERKFVHEAHDPYALAATRSKNRAISDIIGLGEVSAEEVLGSEEFLKDIEKPAEAEKPLRTIRWTVRNEEFPIPIEGEQARPYIGLMRNRLMKALAERGIVLEEEIVGGYLVSIKSSSMDEKSWDEFSNGLEWAIRTIAQCKKEDVRIEVI
jgi:hypothetical protein